MKSEVAILNTDKSIIGQIVAELRDVKMQTDSMRFRQNIKRLGWLMAYEVSKELEYSKEAITTPLGKAQEFILTDSVVLGTVLRAGLPFHQGFLDIFDKAENAYVGASRVEIEDKLPEIMLGYSAGPKLEGKTLVMVDPMIATGQSLVEAIESLIKQNGEPKRIIVAGAIAAKSGIEYVQEKLPRARIYVAAVDAELNDKYYIVPGLGDAGDLALGPKN